METPRFFEFRVRPEFVAYCVARATTVFAGLAAFLVDPMTMMAPVGYGLTP
jgi:hypothetical protein